MSVKATEFVFEEFSFDSKSREALFDYRILLEESGPLIFTERLVFPQSGELRDKSEDTLNALLRNLHIGLGLSYFKLYCPSKVTLSTPLSDDEADFWTKTYRNGLGEFFYRNGLDPDKCSPNFDGGATGNLNSIAPTNERALVGIGGGKDSIVVAELMKAEGYDFDSFVVETQKPSEIINATAEKIGVKLFKVERFLDEKLFEEHPDSYNGHIPISSLIAWIGYFAAVLYGYKFVVVGNEHSSSFGNLAYRGEEINHQWSKSAEFEKMFQSLTSGTFGHDITYFSLMRPFYELRIVEMFSKYEEYFPLFSSCNKNFTIHKERHDKNWCGECPKCAFMFLMLSAWLPADKVISIFDKNLLDDEALLDTYKDLLGLGDLKPFDCVGTFEETQAALWMSRDKFKDTVIVKTYLDQLKNAEVVANNILKTQAADTVPARFKLLGMKSALILGYGKEGKASEEYLKKTYPNLEIGVVDKGDDENYLSKQVDYDIIIKTPGIPKESVTRHYTTATNIFMSRVSNIVVGVTGTKGKSTTASLISSILDVANRPYRLLGNIGSPMLESLAEIKPDDIIILELSSFQLDDIEFSPNIAVVLNLFEDHLDYHGDTERYHEAKKNIIRHQSQDDFLIYNEDDEKLRDWASDSLAQTIPFGDDILVSDEALPLIGDHNKKNLRAAVTVARALNISDNDIARGIKQFEPLPHRLENVGTFKGISFYDDAISTTPESTIEALRALKNVETIFLGGLDRGYDFSELSEELKRSDVKNVVLFPDNGPEMVGKDHEFNVLETESMEEAVRFAFENTNEGKICLLSAASPSYSLWKNFEEKGDEFQRYIKNG